jgi:hypothetical protein
MQKRKPIEVLHLSIMSGEGEKNINNNEQHNQLLSQSTTLLTLINAITPMFAYLKITKR